MQSIPHCAVLYVAAVPQHLRHFRTLFSDNTRGVRLRSNCSSVIVEVSVHFHATAARTSALGGYCSSGNGEVTLHTNGNATFLIIRNRVGVSVSCSHHIDGGCGIILCDDEVCVG